jgi:hypothetical protein
MSVCYYMADLLRLQPTVGTFAHAVSLAHTLDDPSLDDP